jgi:hypothetical protein
MNVDHHTLGTGLLALLLLCMGCVSATPDTSVGDQIVAVGWTSSAQPIALARPLVSLEAFRTLVLLGPGNRTTVDLSLSGRFRVVRATRFAGSKSFVVVVEVESADGEGREHRCLLVSLDGATSSCPLPDPLGEWRFSEDGHEIFGVRPGRWRPYSFDIRDGQQRELDSPLRELQLISNVDYYPAWVPCEAGLTLPRISPTGTRIAFACTDRSLWVAASDGNPRQLLQASSEPLYLSLGDHHISTAFGTLEWSPDESMIYYCQGAGELGHVVYLDNRPAVPHEQCFLAGAWSPDSSQVAGDSDGKLERWQLPELSESAKD